jgi:DNA polymerase-3 subunit chi
LACQVDFYVLAESAPSAEQLACRLSLMAWEQGHRVSVLAPDENAARSLDELMWDYPAGRFLPHQRGESGQDTAGRGEAGQGDAIWAAPVSIVASADQVGADRDVVVNLGDTAVPHPDRFRRLLEIVPAELQLREASRDKFRHYLRLGLRPVKHDIQNF